MIKSDKWIKRMCLTNMISIRKRHRLNDKQQTYLVHIEKMNEFLEQHCTDNDAKIINNFLTTTNNIEKELIFIGCYYVFEVIKIEDLRDNQLPMIEPFFPESINRDSEGNKIPSYGTSSFGYDVRLDTTIKIFKTNDREPYENIKEYEVIKHGGAVHKFLKQSKTDTVIDPTNFNPDVYEEFKNVKEIIIPPRGFILGNTMEYFRMPKRAMGLCIGKSTWARCGLHPLVTPLEVCWSGYLTLELANLTDLPIRVQTGVGIAQINFYESDEDCDITYSDRGGKYQDQGKEPVDPKV